MGKPSFLDIADRLIMIVKARLLRFIESFEDPSATFDMAFRNFEETIKMLKRGAVLMEAYKYELDNWEGRLHDAITRCGIKVKNAIRKEKQGDETAADIKRIWTVNLIYFRNQVGTAKAYREKLMLRLKVIKRELLKADAVKEAVKMRGELAKIRLVVATKQVEYYEEITGLKKGGTSLYEALTNLERAGEKKEATAQAMEDLVNQGFIASVAEEALGPVDETEVDKVLAQLEKEVKDIQRKDVEEPLTLESVPLPARRKKKGEQR